jgi:tetratricopeptide (TPR) repeat protein
MSRRLSRKEIKQKDSFMEQVGETIEFVSSHLRSLIWIGIALIGAIILVAIFINFQRGRAARADQALADAMQFRQAPIVGEGEDSEATESSFDDASIRRQQAIEAFEAVVRDYSGTSSAAIATAYLGEIAAESGDYEAARASWEGFLRGQPQHFLADEIELNLMALDRAEGKGDELVTSLRARLSSGDASLPPDLVLYELAVTLDSLGRSEEATVAYQRIVEEHPNSAFSSEARSRSGSSDRPLLDGL